MGFSSVAIEKRQKEAEARRSFLILSLIGSLALHVAVLAFGINNLLNRTPEIKEEPLEITLVKPPPTPKPEKPPEKPQQQAIVGGSARGSSPPNQRKPQTTTRTSAKPAPKIVPSPPPVAEKQPPPKPTESRQELIEDLQEKPVPQPKPTPKPEVAAKPLPPKPLTPPPARTSAQDAARLRNALGTESSSTPKQGRGEGSGANVATGSGSTEQSNPRRQGSGADVATGSGSAGQRNSRGQGSGEGDAEGSGSGASCRSNCKPNYPELARRRGKEGKVAVRVIADADGNVTSAEVVRSSGSAALDQAALKQAKKAKIKAQPGKPVTMNFTFSLKD